MNLKVLPEFIGHRVTCKGCKQTIRANLIDERIVVSRVLSEDASRLKVGGESELQRPAITEHPTESQPGLAASEAVSVEHPEYGEKSNSSRETLPEATVLRNPLDDRVAELQKALRAQEAETDRLRAELQKSQNVKVADDAERVKETERRSRLINALGKAQSKHEHLRAARETVLLEAEGLRERIKALERSLTDASVSRADAEAAQAAELQEERGRADAAARALQTQWEMKSESLLNKEEEFRTRAAKAEADRQRLQSQLDALRAHAEQECGILKEELTRHQEQAARFALERDRALERQDSLVPASEHEQLRAAREAAEQETESLRGRVKELERSLTNANTARAAAEASFTVEMQEVRSQTDAELRALQAQLELKSEDFFRRDEESRSAAAKMEAERQRLQSQIDALRAHAEKECGTLKEELTRHQEQAASVAIERDRALRRIDSLASGEVGLTEQIRAAARARQETEERQQAEIMRLKHNLEAASEQREEATRRLNKVTEQLGAEQKEREKQQQSERQQTQKLAALEEELRIAEVAGEEEKKQNLTLYLKSAENYALLKVEAQRLGEVNAVLRGAHDRLLADCNEGSRARKELIQQVQDLESRLTQEKLRADTLHQELGSTKHDAEAELKRLTESWTKEQAHLQTEERRANDRLAAAMRTFDQERTAIHSKIERLQEEISSLRVQRDELRDQLAHLAEEKEKLKLDSVELSVSHQDAEERWRIEATSLSQAALQAQQDLQKLQKELDEHHQRATIHLTESATLQKERETAKQETAAVRKELDSVRETYEHERLGLESELEDLRQQLLESANTLALEGRFKSASTNLEARLPAEVARLNEFAKRIETLEAELERRSAARSEAGRQRHRGLALIGGPLRLLWNRPARSQEDSQDDEQAPERRLRALWTEVMSKRERVIHETANTMHTNLENQLAELQGQLASALERADRLEAELEAMRRPEVGQES